MHQCYDLTMSQESSNSKTDPTQKVDLYKRVTQYKTYTKLSEHNELIQQLIKFINYEVYKVLFVFGPTGCGKHIAINNFLTKYQIPYEKRAQQIVYNQNQTEFNNYFNQWESQTKVKRIIDLLYQSIQNQTNDINVVQVYEDFPIINPETTYKELQQIKKFRLYFFKQIKKAKAKIIFILNSDIYNPYHIIKDLPDEVRRIILKNYTSGSIRKICNNFVQEFPKFQIIQSNKDTMDQIVEVSNGDARKALLNLYKYYIENKVSTHLNKSHKKQHKLKLKNQQKIKLFHLLGKYLYAKRYDPTDQTDKQFSRDELIKLDPPFYFDPVSTYRKSGIPLSTFTDFLFQNYLDKIATIQDAKNISSLFAHLDSIFPQFITNKRVDSLSQQSQAQYIFQLTWGIILMNKSSKLVKKKFLSLRKSQSNSIMKQIQQKRQMLRIYFPFLTLSSLVRFGHIVKNSRIEKPFLIKSIINRRGKKIQSFQEGNQNQVIDRVEQEQEISNCTKDFLKNFKQKLEKAQLMRLAMKELEQENDIDSDIQQQM